MTQRGGTKSIVALLPTGEVAEVHLTTAEAQAQFAERLAGAGYGAIPLPADYAALAAQWRTEQDADGRRRALVYVHDQRDEELYLLDFGPQGGQEPRCYHVRLSGPDDAARA